TGRVSSPALLAVPARGMKDTATRAPAPPSRKMGAAPAGSEKYPPVRMESVWPETSIWPEQRLRSCSQRVDVIPCGTGPKSSGDGESHRHGVPPAPSTGSLGPGAFEPAELTSIRSSTPCTGPLD